VTRTWAVYAMATSCVGPWDDAGRMVRGQETLSMPSANDAFMSLTSSPEGTLIVRSNLPYLSSFRG
jgi:hypothetical protein